MADSIVVMGGAGFIGRHLVERLARDGRHVIAATRHPARFNQANVENVVAPYDRLEDFVPVLKRSSAVFHAASESTPGSTEARPQLDGNLRSTLALIEALQIFPDRRLIFLSSGGTLYGDRVAPAVETDPLRPRSYHGAGKAAAEHFIQAWSTQYAGTAVLLRPSNVYGPRQSTRPGFGVIPAAFDCIRRDIALTVWGKGEAVRDYLFVDDLVTLCTLAVDHDFPSGPHPFNVASGVALSLHRLFDAIGRAAGIPLRVAYEPARRVDVRQILLDTQATRAAFGWEPEMTLERGLESTWQWLSTQP